MWRGSSPWVPLRAATLLRKPHSWDSRSTRRFRLRAIARGFEAGFSRLAQHCRGILDPMPELQYAVLADHVRVQDNLGYVIAAGIDRIHVAEVPAVQDVGVLLSIAYSRAECGRPHRIEVLFQGTDGEELVRITGTGAPEWSETLPVGWKLTTRVGLNFRLPLPHLGLYSMEVMIDDASAASIPVRVVQRGPDESAPTD